MKRHLVGRVVVHTLDDVNLAVIRPGFSFGPDARPNLVHSWHCCQIKRRYRRWFTYRTAKWYMDGIDNEDGSNVEERLGGDPHLDIYQFIAAGQTGRLV